MRGGRRHHASESIFSISDESDISTVAAHGGLFYDTVRGEFFERKPDSGQSVSSNFQAYHANSTKYTYWDGDKKKEGTIGVTVSTILTDATANPLTYTDALGKKPDEYWFVVKGNVKITHGLTLDGKTHIVLTDGSRLEIAAEPNAAGIRVTSGQVLQVYGQELGTGTLVAHGGTYAAGIGGGADSSSWDSCDGDGGKVFIHGGEVIAVGGSYNGYCGAGIGPGYGGESGDLTIRAKVAFEVYSGESEPGEYHVDYASAYDQQQRYVRIRELDPVKYVAWESNAFVEKACTGYRLITPATTDLADEGWYVVKGNVNLDHGLTLKDEANIILTDGSRLTIRGRTYEAGLEVEWYPTDNDDLFIYGQRAGTGILEAHGGANAAGIGGNDSKGAGHGDTDCGNVLVYGGTVLAYGGEDSAGIGGGSYCTCGTVSVSVGEGVEKVIYGGQDHTEDFSIPDVAPGAVLTFTMVTAGDQYDEAVTAEGDVTGGKVGNDYIYTVTPMCADPSAAIRFKTTVAPAVAYAYEDSKIIFVARCSTFSNAWEYARDGVHYVKIFQD